MRATMATIWKKIFQRRHEFASYRSLAASGGKGALPLSRRAYKSVSIRWLLC